MKTKHKLQMLAMSLGWLCFFGVYFGCETEMDVDVSGEDEDDGLVSRTGGVSRFVLVNSRTNSDIKTLGQGETIALDKTGPFINIRAEINGSAGSVAFELNQKRVGVENVKPYALAGDTNGDYQDWSVNPGAYVLSAIPFSASQATGVQGKSLTLKFSVTRTSGDPGDGDTDGDTDSGTGFQGRVAISSDGNQHDADDWGATALSLAILSKAGLKNNLVHYDYSSHIWNSNSKGPAQMEESAMGGARRFGFNTSVFFNDTRSLSAAINNIKTEVNKSSSTNRLFYVIAGPMEVAWRGLKAADPSKLKYVTCISHSTWNDNHAKNDHNGHSFNDLLSLGCVNGHIGDQNPGFYTKNMSAWNWLKGTNQGVWLYGRIDAVHTIGGCGIGDASDSGMIFYLVTGNKNGNSSILQNWWSR